MPQSVKIKYETEFMKVECEQDLQRMQPIEKGMFCDSCQKPVYDFTNWERNRIIEFYKTRPTTCGLFTTEQLDPSLHPIDFFFRMRTRYLLIPFLAFIGLPGLKAQDKVKNTVSTEAAPDSSGKTKLKKKDIVIDESTGALIKKPDKTYVVNPPVAKEKDTKGKKKYYWSKRFPFIHKKRYTWMGCPRF